MKGALLIVLGGVCGALATFFLMAPQRIIVASGRTSSIPSQVAAIAPASTASLPTSSSTALMPESAASMPAFPEPAPATPVVDSSPRAPMALPTAPPSPGMLMIPVEGIMTNQLTDTFDDARAAGRRHDAIDIMAPKGTRVLAAADGKVVKLFTSARGGLTVYEFDPTATYTYYYAHLDSYAPALAEGMQLKRGDLIGFVGSTGDASPAAPHLHFEITLLGADKNWWHGTAINPYPVLTGRQSLTAAAAAAGSASTTH